MEFLSVQNFKICNDIFCKYMQDEFGVRVDEESELKKSIYTVMQKVNQSGSGTLKTLNNAVLNEVRDLYLQKHNLGSAGQKKLRMRNLERDQKIFGNRANHLGEQIKFEMNPPRRETVNKVEDIVNERANAFGGADQRQSALPFEVLRVPEPPTGADLIKQMQAFEKAREHEGDPTTTTAYDASKNARFEDTLHIGSLQRQSESDPKSLYQMPKQQDKASLDRAEEALKAVPYQNFSQQSIIKQGETYDKKTYILFNGYDRDWETHPFRYNFTLDVNSVTRSLKNITEISFTRLIIPMEVLQRKTTSAATDSRFYNQYGLTYPYLMLQVDELSPGMYEGFNKATQRCFTSFVYHREYRASNGRGFIVMQPLQDEKKEYRGAPLSALPRMTLRVVKPNGTLYNMAKDDNRIDFLLYESINPILLKIICKDFFDINEYAVGDLVQFKDFRLLSPEAFVLAVTTAGGVVSASDFALYRAGVNALEEFMNRDEGHEIIMTGNPNASSFMNSFSVYMPRMLDKATGSLVLQKDIFDTINVMQSYLQQVTHANTGKMINATLQVVVTMKVKTSSADIAKLVAPLN